MSGIAGIFHLDSRPVDPRLLEAMSTRMAHRGPDGSGSWIDGPVGLTHRMLQATPESLREVQPLRDESGQLVLVFDGRIDNRDELKAAIESIGGRLRDDTDAELVLKAYEAWAEDCPKHLLGDFAFAIWDARKRRLFCARDPLGNKPFFYRCDGKTFAFASEMQPLFADPAFPPRLNLPLLGMFLRYCYGSFEETLYQGVLRLPAAHSLHAENAGVSKQRYWEADPAKEIRYATDDEYAQHFLELFRRSVRHCLRAHGVVGAALSGGLDSSSIVCTAASLYRDGSVVGTGPVTFSQLFGDLPCDESQYIREVVHHWKLESWGEAYDADPALTDLERNADYPDIFYEPTRLMFISAMREMQRRNIRVHLEGMGGDELMVPGFGHLYDLTVQGHWVTLMRHLRNDAAESMSGTNAFQLFLNYCLRPLVPGRVKAVLRPLLTPLRAHGRSSILLPSFVVRHQLDERICTRLPVPSFASRAQQDVYHACFQGWNVLASEMDELFAARFGIECRFPFREQRLLEFMLAVPQEQRCRHDESKFVMRQAMKGLLPEKIRQRKDKAAFDIVLDQVLGDRQAQPIQRLLRNSILVALGVVDQQQLQRLLADYGGGTRGLTMAVLFVIQLELFCRAVEGVSVVEQEAV